MDGDSVCPHCGASQRGDPILSYTGMGGEIEPGSYDRATKQHVPPVGADGQPITGPGVHVYDNGVPQYGSLAMGHEEPGVYDGILYWECLFCNGLWHAHPKGSPPWAKAVPFVGTA